jgi:nitrogenase-stabilizing/protective protein
MTGQRLDDELQDLSSAEDFLEYFGVAYDQKVVQVNRLHILQRFHDYLAQAGEVLPEADEPRREVYKRLLARAYQDFVESDALTEKVFKVFHEVESQTFIPLESLGGESPTPGGGN